MMKKTETISNKKLSDVRFLQIAEMKNLCVWVEERLKDLHYKFTILLDKGTDKEIEEYMEKAQPFFVFLKNALGGKKNIFYENNNYIRRSFRQML